jgi:hypothetical protein
MTREEKAARIWMQREGFILKTTGSFHSDICSEGIEGEDTAKVFQFVRDTLKRQADNYTAAINEILGDLPMPWCGHCQSWHHTTAPCYTIAQLLGKGDNG